MEKVADDLLSLEGMDKPLAAKLAKGGVIDRESLADLATDELIDLTGIDAARATALITVARAHWFAEEE